MIYELKNPTKMGIYVNKGKRTIHYIRDELGADVLCNLNLFNSDWTGACYTRSKNQVVGSDGYVYETLAFNSDSTKMVKSLSNNNSQSNSFGCLKLIDNGQYCVTTVPSWASGKRQRTAIGIKADGTPVIFCDSTAKTVQEVAKELMNAGVVYAINVDGGSSSQMICPVGTVYGQRVVHTLFYAVLDKQKLKTECPYPEPTRLIWLGCRGDDVKWVQWMLNKCGYSLEVDGICGGITSFNIGRFQIAHSLIPDMIVGKDTTKAMKGVVERC